MPSTLEGTNSCQMLCKPDHKNLNWYLKTRLCAAKHLKPEGMENIPSQI